ncbi:DUF1501 domain-containing protein [Hyphobacterium sp. HN65]|uniref:DUF1501 domain-containing protein n=1 Tax=Hyphobacterium lacteum TaxID=3116575 RepID=A0ABU7LQ54_9PROT|nr:DUF1501 domain-containing protein [Hyphobacterium sp. HN65]MEE2526038.1 DUF1501 domain-containing protein [Hyphobacterium sp. HN65]
MPINRREILKLVAGSSAAALIPAFARAQTVGTGAGYRAIVALFMHGGNDSNNMLIPNDVRYTDYASARGSAIAVPQDQLLPLAGTPMGVHPSLSPLVQLWNEGDLNWVQNAGTLLQPLTRELYQDRPDLRPVNLFSHDAQQNLWQTGGAASELLTGWMGRVGDQFVDAGHRYPSVSLSGAQRALIGDRNSPLLISGSNLSRNGYDPGNTSNSATTRRAALDALMAAPQVSDLGNLTTAIMRNDLEAGAVLNDILNGDASVVDAAFVDPQGNPVTGNLATSLRHIARLIEARNIIGSTRQTFMAETSGFDNHRNQAATHAELLSNIARCVFAFQNTMRALGVADDVTLFSMSDFNRVFRGNGSLGSDHAWGGHHFVAGGSLIPQQMLGTFPDLTLGGPDDIRDNGRWIPSTSLEEYLGALVSWLGVGAADMPYVFPNWSTWNGGGRGPVRLFA